MKVILNPISVYAEKKAFNNLQKSREQISAEIQNLKNIGLSQKDLLIRTITQNSDPNRPEMAKKFSEMFQFLIEGKFSEAMQAVKEFLPNEAAMKKTSLGTAIMAKGWAKPIVFPHQKGFKWLGWVDSPDKISTKDLWESAYGEQPSLIIGAVGNSNIKPEQVKGGCSMSKKELSALYEKGIQEFFNPIFRYFKELGVKSQDIGFAFAHSDCGVDKAARTIVEQHNLKGFATTPTEYTQYIRGLEKEATAEFPNGYLKADFPYPTVLTRNLGQIEDYAKVYSKLVGKDNPIGVFSGGEHAFVRDAGEALIGKDGSCQIPIDIMKDLHGIVIPAKKDGTVTNAARYILEKVDGNPYEQFTYAFKNYLPDASVKSDIAQYDPQMAMTTVMHSRLAKAGKIPNNK